MIERWELIQAQSLSEKHRHKQDVQQWQQLSSDLQNMRAWLGRSEAELGQLRGLVHSADIHTIQQRIKKLKVAILTLISSLENHCLSPHLFHFHFFYTFSIPLYFFYNIYFVRLSFLFAYNFVLSFTLCVSRRVHFLPYMYGPLDGALSLPLWLLPAGAAEGDGCPQVRGLINQSQKCGLPPNRA